MTGSSEKKTPIIAVGGVAFDEAGRVLLIKRGKPPSKGLWTVPGGRVEYGETLIAACQREIKEETSLHVGVGRQVAFLEKIDPGGAYHFLIVDFLVEVQGGELAAGSDADEVRWVSQEELCELRCTEGLVDVLDEVRRLVNPS